MNSITLYMSCKLCFWFLTNQRFAIIILIAFITNNTLEILVPNNSPNGLSSYSVRCLINDGTSHIFIMLSDVNWGQVRSSDAKWGQTEVKWGQTEVKLRLSKLWYKGANRHRRFWATDVNRKLRLLLFDVYFTLFIQKDKL